MTKSKIPLFDKLRVVSEFEPLKAGKLFILVILLLVSIPAFAQTIQTNPDSIPFAPAVYYSISGWARSVFSADLDGDGHKDLAVAYFLGAVAILKNNGDGTFQPRVEYGLGGCHLSAFCADLDRDGDFDLAVTTYTITSPPPESDYVSILKNNGDGTFQTAVNYGITARPHSVFCADLDGDGDLDLVVAHGYSDNISILKNNGDGTFQSAISYVVGDGPYSVFCADLDDDGDKDLAVANSGEDNVSILKNNGDGVFQAVGSYDVGWTPYSVFCADLDQDTDLDLAVANYSGSVSILKNNGDGTFQSAVDYGTEYDSYSVFCADLDGDGYLDLAVAYSYGGSNYSISILKNNGDGTFQTRFNYSAGQSARSVFCADLDDDGDKDLAVGLSGNVSILLNQTVCSGNDLIIPYLEVNEVLPDSICELIPDKKTVVRACVKAQCNRVLKNVTGRLYVYKDGQPMTGSPFSPYPPRMNVKSYYSEEEIARSENTMNFYVGNLSAGNYSAYAVINGIQSYTKYFTVSSQYNNVSTDLPAQSLSTTPEKYNILFVRVIDKDGDLPKADIIPRSVSFMNKLYPLPENLIKALDYGSTPTIKNMIGENERLDTDKRRTKFCNALAERRNNYNSTKPPSQQADRVVGVMDYGNFVYDGDQMLGFGSVKSFKSAISDEYVNVLSHEIGHNYDLGDEYTNSSHGSPSPNNPVPNGCSQGNEVGNYVDKDAFDPTSKEQRWKTKYFYQFYESDCSIMDRKTVSFMGGTPNVFEFASGKDGKFYWVTKTVYNYLQSHLGLQNYFKITSGKDTTNWFLKVSGLIWLDDSIQVDPILTVHGAYPDNFGPGEYSLELLDSRDSVLSQLPFALNFFESVSGPTDVAAFLLYVPSQEAIRKIKILHGEILLKTISATPSVPSITVVVPNGGEVWSGLDTVKWSGADLDGDTLSYSVLFSPDGVNWDLVVSDISDTFFVWNTDLARGGDSCLIKVTVSDGFNSSEDVSDSYFSIATKFPEVTIVYPPDSLQVLHGAVLDLKGAGSDPEDGILPDSTLRWYSNLDGYLGSGAALDTVPLSRGNHLIKLGVEDSDGNVKYDSVTVLVSADADSDGMADDWEVAYGLDTLLDDSQLDPDNDHLVNRDEFYVGTDPLDYDSDDDGYADGIEVGYHSNPTDFSSIPLLISGFSLLAPEDSTVVFGDSIHFYWNSSTHPDPDIRILYRLYWSSYPNFAIKDSSVELETSSCVLARVFQAHWTYYWKVRAFTSFGSEVWSNQVNRFIYLAYLSGDANGDGVINVTDVVYLINYLFLVPPGPAPQPWAAGDANCDGTINITDVVYLINYLFLVPPGPPPGC